MTTAAFASLGLAETLLEALNGLGFAAMTAVQERALPGVLGREDLIVQAEPGSGKTVAFGLGMLTATLPHLPPAPPRVRALALCPTRELAEQIAEELRKLARRTPNVKVLALCGGVPFAPQRASLRQGAHVLVGTPGRIEEHLRKGSLELAALELLVLDEADRMLSMGFAPQIESVLQHCPPERQTLLCSATIPSGILELSRGYQRRPRHVHVESARSGEAPATAREAGPAELAGAAPAGAALEPCVEQRFYRVPTAQRTAALVRWLSSERPSSALVFCNTRVECAEVAAALERLGWVAGAIHGELPQRQRAHVMRLFANGSCSVLAATDVAARGWDIGGLAAVVNLGLSRDPSVHLHRVGRTGRAGQAGLAASFVAEEDLGPLAAIERDQGFAAVFHELPEGAAGAPPQPPMVTLLLSAGKNKKLGRGDILGALTGAGSVSGDDVGPIHIGDSDAYVAVRAAAAEAALARLREAPVKGRPVKAQRAALSVRDKA